MAKFCKNCGTPLKEGAKFCTECGKSLTLNESSRTEEKTVPAVEKSLPDAPQSNKSVPAASQKTEPTDASPDLAERQTQKEPANEKTTLKQKMSVAKQIAENKTVQTAEAIAAKIPTNSLASSTSGETLLGTSAGFGSFEAGGIPDTAKLFATSFKSFFRSLIAFLNDPKKLIIPLVLAGLWIILDVLKALNVNNFFVRMLSFLTFAKGGLYGGFFGFIGGIVGKSVFAGALTMIAASIMQKKKGQKQSLADTIKSIFAVSLDSLGGYLTGIGAAMLLYLFISGGLLRTGLPVGLAAAYLSARATLKRGFLQNLIGSFTAKGKTSLGFGAMGAIKGLTVGFAAAALIGQLQMKLVVILPGALLMVGGIVLIILQKKGIIKSEKEEQRR